MSEVRTVSLGPCGCETTFTLENVVEVKADPHAWDFLKGLHHCEEKDVD